MAKQMNARIAQKHDSLENWNKAESFIPMNGEFFLVDDLPCPIVVGNGTDSAKTLAQKPLFAPITNDEIDSLFGGTN